MHLGPNPDSVVPTGLDLGATCIPGLKPGAILFRPFGTECAPARQRVPVRTGKRSATEGSEIPEFEHAGAERGHVPSAAPARQRVPVRTGGQPRGAAPTRGIRWATPTRRHCARVIAAPKRRPRIARGSARGQRRAQSKSRQGRKKIAPGFNPGSRQPPKPPVP